jgi:tRNA-dihydrouridine synthase
MLAPMQGLTNRALRAYFIEHVRPDVIFTEFMRQYGTGGNGPQRCRPVKNAGQIYFITTTAANRPPLLFPDKNFLPLTITCGTLSST